MPSEAGRRRFPLVPVLLVALAIVKGVLWSLTVPPWYGPDEPAHFDYVALIAVKHKLPVPLADPARFAQTQPLEVICSEIRFGFRSNGGYLAEPPWGRDPEPGCPLPGDQSSRAGALDANPAGDYLPPYYAAGALLYLADWSGSVEDRLHSVRLLSVLLGALATLMTYLAGIAFFGRRSLATTAALVFALQPMASQQFAVVNNDALLIAVAAVFFWRYFVAVARGVTYRELALLGLLAGLDYLAKPQGAFLLAPVAWLIVAEWWRRRSSRTALVAALVAGVAAAVPIVVGFGTALLIHGTVAPVTVKPPPGYHGLTQYVAIWTYDYFQHAYWLWVGSSWGLFGWLSVQLPVAVLAALTAVLVLSVAGAGWAFASRRHPRSMLLAAAVAVLAVTLIVVATDAIYFRTHGSVILAGRSFFFLMPAGSLLIVAGLTALVPRSAERVMGAAVAVAALLLNVISLVVLSQAWFL